MLRFAPALALLAVTVLPVPARARGLWDFIRGKRELEVITVTEVSSMLLPAATPAEPQYYVAASLGYRELGGPMAGNEEPPDQAVLHLISSQLAKRGYLPGTSRSTAPSLLLVYTWGTLNADYFYNGDPTLPPTQINRGQIVHFLGGQKAGIGRDFFDPLAAPVPGLTAYNYEARSILEVSRESFYVIVVSAYDLESALQKKRRPPLWTTRIAAPSLGFNLGDVLPAMLAIGGEQFGRDTPRPVWTKASDKFQPNVTLGELQLLDTLKGDPLPVMDAKDTVIKKK